MSVPYYLLYSMGVTQPCPLPFLQPASRQIFKDEFTLPPRIFLHGFKKEKEKINFQ
jgi:hypothetical protein